MIHTAPDLAVFAFAMTLFGLAIVELCVATLIVKDTWYS